MSKPARFDEIAVVRLGQTQEMVLSRRQLSELSVDRHHIGHRVSGGRWQTIGPRVVVLHSGVLTDRQRLWVATLHSGPDSALAGLTAAAAEGLTGFDSPTLHTLVPHGSYAADLVHPVVRVRVRQSRTVVESSVHPVRLPRRQRLAPALVTAADGAARPDRARLIILSAVQQRLVRPDDLTVALRAHRRLARRGLLIETIDDAAGGAHSLPERSWSRLRRTYGLPPPTAQRAIRRRSGTWYLDSDFLDWLVSVEVNGSQHELWVCGERDDHRRNVLGIGGRLVITLSSYGVRHEGEMCAVTVAAALLSRGWEPSPAVRRGLTTAADRVGMDLTTADWVATDRVG